MDVNMKTHDETEESVPRRRQALCDARKILDDKVAEAILHGENRRGSVRYAAFGRSGTAAEVPAQFHCGTDVEKVWGERIATHFTDAQKTPIEICRNSTNGGT